MAKDPICGMEVEPSEAAASYDYEGTMYYFCAVGCKEKFKQNPERYVESEGSGEECC
jgi:YHS domain-containing protein